MAIEEKDRDDVMDRLLQLGGDKKFLSYDDLKPIRFTKMVNQKILASLQL